MELAPAVLAQELHSAIVNFHNEVNSDVLNRLRQDGIYTVPRTLEILFGATNELIRSDKQNPDAIRADLLPWLKRAVLHARLNLANRLDMTRAYVSDPGTIEELEKQLAPLSEIMTQGWFKKTQPARTPQLTDFLTVERAEKHLGADQCATRQYDEKFHILQAPSLFLGDLDHYRRKCSLRNVALVVGYLDIDKFKDFNTKYGETQIDLRLLPRFMAALEAHVYSRGFAYCFGGDEYVVLLPNAAAAMGRNFFRNFQTRIGSLDYGGIAPNPTVSVGFCEVEVESYFTNQEVLGAVERAKNVAKKHGAGRLVTFADASYDEAEVLDVA